MGKDSSDWKDLGFGIVTGGLYTVADKIGDEIQDIKQEGKDAVKYQQDQLDIQAQMAKDAAAAAEETRQMQIDAAALNEQSIADQKAANDVAASDRADQFAESKRANKAAADALSAETAKQAAIAATEQKRVEHQGDIAQAETARTDYKTKARRTRAMSGGGLLSGGDTGIMTTKTDSGKKATLGA